MSVSTKQRIMDAAIILFSEQCYDMVSMRDIAKVVGITAASIYNHFDSKQALLLSMYEFFSVNKDLARPDTDMLVRLAETAPLDEVFASFDYRYHEEVQDAMDRILLIATQRFSFDKDSEDFVNKHFFESTNYSIIPVLNKLIELGRIEPIDVEAFALLTTFNTYSAAVFNRSSMKISLETWHTSLKMLFSLIQPTQQCSM
jgi:AcrR family transcriptional regulator